MSNDPSQTKVDIEKLNLLSQLRQLCDHKWVFQGSDFKKENGGLDKYQRIDTYYCEKCLEIRELVNKEGKGTVEPYWFNPMVRIQRF